MKDQVSRAEAKRQARAEDERRIEAGEVSAHEVHRANGLVASLDLSLARMSPPRRVKARK
jgi:hypothetical protein